MTRAIMIQGAGSNVGKSIIVAGLARAFSKRGLNVRPFKPQNMSNNAAVTIDGGEIGRAQALQARASGHAPHTDMNPVLLKPESERGAQVILRGRRLKTLHAREYAQEKPALLGAVLESYRANAVDADLVLVEGAGSPAEINLRAGDIANMGFATAAQVPVVIIGDIDRGGVIAQLAGTHAVLDAADRDRIQAFAVNKFRGDPSLFVDGVTAIEQFTGWPSLGVIPWFEDAWRLPAEDILDIRSRSGGGSFKVVVPKLPRIANFDDLDPLNTDPAVQIELVHPGQALPGDADLVVLPGSKSTISDLASLRAQGWDIDLYAHVRRGGHVIGICGGYQMLGRSISDPEGIEGDVPHVEGLGLLNVETRMTPEKRLRVTDACDLASGHLVSGYEIHVGETTGPDCSRPWLSVDGSSAGASSPDGRILGCYLHGLFSADEFRTHFLQSRGAKSQLFDYSAGVDEVLDDLALHLQEHLDLDALYALAQEIPASLRRNEGA